MNVDKQINKMMTQSYPKKKATFTDYCRKLGLTDKNNLVNHVYYTANLYINTLHEYSVHSFLTRYSAY